MNEDELFNSLLEDKRHKELIKALTSILDKLNTTTNLSSVETLLKKIADKNDSETPKSISLIGKAIINKMEELKKSMVQKTEWKFTIERDNEGYITTVIAN